MGKKSKFIVIILCVLVLAGLITISFRAHIKVLSDNLLCPSAYPTAEEATASFQTFSNNFYNAHSGASVGDLLKARYDFYVSHNCTQELAAYKQAQDGTADPATMQKIDTVIQAH